MNLARYTILSLCPFVLMACQQYAPSRLDLNAYHASLTARDPFSGEVGKYAGRLATPTTQSTTFDAKDGLTLAEAEVVALFFNPDLRLARLRADGSHVYFVTGHSLKRVAVGGGGGAGAAEEVVSMSRSPSSLLVGPDAVYYTDYTAGRIYSVRK